jgi:methylated-DNA-[protein]-cysteine S-methyltransferase
MKPETFYWSGPFGTMGVTAEGRALTRVFWATDYTPTESAEPGKLFQQAFGQLEEYFAVRRRNFSLPLAPAGTEFQRRVWAALEGIPYGQTISYGTLAARAGHPRAFRAAGQACRRNPLSVIVPCHRVVGRDGRLTGFAGGLDLKSFLLRLEARGETPGPGAD